MVKFIFSFLLISCSFASMAQTREELEKQKAQLKKDLEQTERLLSENKTKSKENFVQWKLINDKVNIQNRIIENVNRDINLLDNSLVTIQRDINRYDKLLDTLKEEYAHSMVYAYKNRSNYDFLNFIFSASTFNDAIKRITYLKSYRNYREMQGQNILRTQELRKQRIEELQGTRQKKTTVLEDKDKEMAVLEVQQKEKDRIMSELKKQGKQLNNQMAATRNQLKKVDNAISAAINKARLEAIKKAKENAGKPAINNNPAVVNAAPATPATGNKPAVKPTVVPAKKPQESVLLNADNIVLNTNFVNNKGSLPWPVDKGHLLMHYGRNQLDNGPVIDMTGITIATDIGTPVKAIFDGTVSAVAYVEDMQVVIIQHGKYFSTYSNLTGVTVQKGQDIKLGQVLGKAAANLDGIGAVDFYISEEKGNQDPERWLRRR
ncbi:MAG: peptidoglycan DD-metalloendopeptidase family protein [Bacteroidetes bacterium]|nr:peptidoglycan DD-metalloendopeptidase family protein [Bacteroidota bacterium]